MNKRTTAVLFLVAVLFLFSDQSVFASGINIVCSRAPQCGDVFTASFIINEAQARTIEAWGMDIAIQGLDFVGVEKSGTLIEKVRTFDINRIDDNKLRCGSYFGKINLQNGATLFALKFVFKSNVRNAEISITDAVDDMGGIEGSKAVITCK